MNKRTVVLINDNLTIVQLSGKVINFSPATAELYKSVQVAEEDDEVERIILAAAMLDKSKQADDYISKLKNVTDLKDAVDILIKRPEFIYEKQNLFLKGSPYPLPEIMVKQFAECFLGDYKLEQLEALKNFWYVLSLNPSKTAREGLFPFLEKTNFKIMGNGMVLAYRKVVSNGAEQDLVKFISNNYMKVKLVKKDNPSNYDVYLGVTEVERPLEAMPAPKEFEYTIDYLDEVERVDLANANRVERKETYILIREGDPADTKSEYIGNLFQLYMDLPDMQYGEFTDQHTRTFKIKIGQEVTMPRENCDGNGANTCSAGLHLCSDLKDYASFGDVSLLCAFSPRNVVSVPETATTKMRVCAYMPLAILADGEESFLVDADTLSMTDEYAVEDLDKVRDELMGKDTSDMSYNQMTALLATLDEIRANIAGRIKNVAD